MNANDGIPPRVHRFASLPSTNDEALRLARTGAPAGEAVVAEEQTAGRGRAGHSWASPPGVALYFSVVLRPRVPPDRLPLATLACGVAVAEAIRAATGLPAGLKWPNDVLVGLRKCAGILCEAETGGPGGTAVVAGVGINVNTPPDALPPRPVFPATSLAAEAGRAFDREVILAGCLARIAAETARLEGPGGAEDVAARFNALDALRGRVLRVELPDGTAAEGANLGAGVDGALRLATPDGPVPILAGSVSLPDREPGPGVESRGGVC